MNIDLPNKRRFTETELARAIDKHVATVGRWTRHGVRGRILRSYLLGGRRYIDREDLVAFLETINAGTHAPPAPNPDRTNRKQRVNAALDRAGF